MNIPPFPSRLMPWLALWFLLSIPSAKAAAVAATYNAANDVPVTSNGYTAAGNTVDFTLNFTPSTGAELVVVKNTGTNFIQGTFSNLSQGQSVPLTFGGATFVFKANYFGGSGNDLVLVWGSSRLIAWGKDDSGQLGDNSLLNSFTPVTVDATGVLAGKTVFSVATGLGHSVALCSDGTLAAWGLNHRGQLGDNSTTDSAVPVAVDMSGVLLGKTVAAVAAGNSFSMALCSDGSVFAWGSNVNGQLGENSGMNSSVPVAVSTTGALMSKTVTAIAAGGVHALALCSDGTLVAWGSNDGGELGNNSTTDSPIPVVVNAAGVLPGKTVTSIAAGQFFNLVLCSDGTIATWGDNVYGQLGDDSNTDRITPVLVYASGGLSGRTVTAIAAGGFHGLALCSDGAVFAWGYNEFGQHGNDSGANALVPVLVSTSGVLSTKTVSSIQAGFLHSVALCSDGTLTSWGYNEDGELGSGVMVSSVAVPGTVSTSSLASGERFARSFSTGAASHTLALVAQPALVVSTLNYAVGLPTAGAVPVTFSQPVLYGYGDTMVVAVPPSGSVFPVGQTTVNITATDASGNVSTGSFTVTVQPLVAGSFYGLSTPSVATSTPGEHVGSILVSVRKDGKFTGKVVLGGKTSAISFQGAFGNDGVAHFGKTGTPTFSVVRDGKPTLELALNIDFTYLPKVGKVTGTLKQGATTVSDISASGAVYTARANPIAPLMNVPVTLLNPASDKGKYTVLFPAKTVAAQGQAAATFPQGDGWALLKVSKSGVVSASGKLGDGSAFSCSKPLSGDNEWPFYAPIDKGLGSVSGVVTFSDEPGLSDAAATDLRWFRPISFSDKLYPNGWPLGIEVDLVASKYIAPPAGQSVLLLPGVVPPGITTNAAITLSDGLLAATESNDVSVSTKSKVTVGSATPTFPGTAKLKCTLATGTGAMSGSFTHTVSTKTTGFKGVILQKQHLGSGYFIGAPAPGSAITPQSGAVGLQ